LQWLLGVEDATEGIFMKESMVLKQLRGLKMNLEEKLKYLEEKGITFQAGYEGDGEVFIAWFPTGTFLDFHWLPGNTRQLIKPTELIRIVDETIEWIEKDPKVLEKSKWGDACLKEVNFGRDRKDERIGE
jgi:hypothetical protein